MKLTLGALALIVLAFTMRLAQFVGSLFVILFFGLAGYGLLRDAVSRHPGERRAA